MNNDTPKFVEIYTESTPNPTMLKFVASHVFFPNQMIECKTLEEAKDSPLAQALFQFDYIESVFISNNFVTISKKETEEEWFELSFELKAFLKEYLLSNKEIATAAFYEKQQKANNEKNAQLDDIDKKIIGLLEKYVKPAVELDGGNIAFKDYTNGVVTLTMQGACAGCPSSTITLKDGIEAMLKRMVPEVTEVQAETE